MKLTKRGLLLVGWPALARRRRAVFIESRFAAYARCWTGLETERDERLRMKVELGLIIAERRLRIAGSPDLEIWVRLGTPRPFPDDPNENHYCPYQITGIGDAKVRYAGGVDSLQALELALHILPTELDSLRRHYPGLGWEDAPEGAYGFSRAVSAFEEDERSKK